MPNIGRDELAAAYSEDDGSDLEIHETDIQAKPTHAATELEEEVNAKEQLKDNLNDDIEKTSGKKARRAEEKAIADTTSLNGEDDDDEAGEDEFEVEQIIAHKFVRGKCLYQVRWKGWSEEDDTWEPSDNLLPDAQKILGAYHHRIGGEPTTKGAKRSKSMSNLTSYATEDTATPPTSKRQKRTSAANNNSNPIVHEEEWSEWTPSTKPNATWEDLVDSIDTVERDPEGNLRAFIRFKNGKKTKVGRQLYIRHCPRAMLKFYEDHLNFRPI